MDRRKEFFVFLGLLLLSGFLFFFRLGTPGLFDADEPAYAEAAREMLETGDWITPHFNGRPRFDKPILFYWLISLSYRVFGISEFAVRVWSALAAVVLVLVVAWGARRWLGAPADLWAGFALTTNLLTALLARAAVTDMLLTLFVTAAILAGVAALEGSTARRRWARLSWTAMGLAVLVKGPVGLLIPVMVLGGSLLLLGDFQRGIARLIPWEGLALFVAITAPWYALVLAANGWAFVEGFVIKHHLTRYTGVVSGHPGPFWFYLPVALVGFFPWSGFLPQALGRALGAARRATSGRHEPADRLVIACAGWFVGVFLFFSLAGTKLPSYLFPAFPAMALLVGSTISNFKPTTDNRSPSPCPLPHGGEEQGEGAMVGFELSVVSFALQRVAPWLIGLTGGILAVGFGLTPWILDAARPLARGVLDGAAIPVGLSWWLAGIVALGTTGGLLARGFWRPGLLAAMMVFLILTAEVAVAPQAYGILQGALREFAQDARGLLGPGDAVVTYGLNAPSIVFYAHRRVIPLGAIPDGTGQLQRLLESGRAVVVITRKAHAHDLDRVPGLFGLKARGGYAIYCSACGTKRDFKLQPGN